MNKKNGVGSKNPPHFHALPQIAQIYRKAHGASAASDLAVPLILKYDQEEKSARATVAAVYDQIIECQCSCLGMADSFL